MNLRSLPRRGAAVAAVAVLSVSLAACGDDSDDSSSNNADDSSQSSDTGDGGDTADTAAAGDQVFGPACDQVPTSGKGSFDGMVSDPVATAASNNPLLKNLVASVGAVDGLGDTLNGATALTVFAPYDPAFEALGTDTVNQLVAGAEKDGVNSDLAKVLSHHVLGENDDPDAVVGQKQTLAEDELTIKGDTDGMTVSDGKVTAQVLCGNIPTGNATVYVIDKVLTGVGS